MKTDDLIAMLASGAIAVEPGAVQRRFAAGLGWGAFATMLVMAIWLGVRRDIAEASQLPMFWAKLALPGGVLAGALAARAAGVGRLIVPSDGAAQLEGSPACEW